jgi:hypothetical protein
MRQLDVDWADLELAFRDATGTENYLDTESGAVMSILSGFEDERDLRDQLKRFPQRFLRLLPLDAGFTKKVLAAFTAHLQHGDLRARLADVGQGAGGLSSSIRILHEDTRTWAQWARFEQGELWQEVQAFLVAHDIRAASLPPTVDLFEGIAEGQEIQEMADAAARASSSSSSTPKNRVAAGGRRSGKKA